MATYIPGVTDYIPQIQPFQPDYNFLSNTLQTRQSRYDVAHKQISSVYGTLLNSPLTREENIHNRDTFFKNIDGDIKRMAGLDLSLKQNQEAASQVFKPFYEDKDMVKDMTWTKNLQNEMQRAESFKYCVDPEKCGGQYWDGGVKALQYRQQEFKNASKEEAINFDNASFTPLINVMDKAMKAAKDAGFKVSFDSVQGGYIVTEKNGGRMVAPLKSFFLSKFGGDPNVMKYYKTQAYIQRKDFIAQNAQQMGGEDKASLAYMNQMYAATTQTINKEHEKAEKNHNNTSVMRKALEKQVKEKGATIHDQSLADMYRSITDQEQMTGAAKEVVQGAKNNADAAKNFSTNARAMGEHLDDLMGFAMLNQEVGNAAKAYADLTSERDLKADPYALASYSSNLSLKNMMAGKAADFEYWKVKEKMKAAEKKAVADREFQEHFNGDLPGSKGQATGVLDEDQARKLNQQMTTDLFEGKKANSRQFLSDLANELRTQYQNTASDPTKQNLISITAEMAFRGTGIDGKKIAAGDNKEIAKLQELDILKASKGYEQAVKTIDPTNGGITGELNADWSTDFWTKSKNQRNAIKEQDKLRGTYTKFLEEQSTKVTNAVAGELQFEDKVTGKQKADLVKTMADLNHNGFLPNLTPGSSSVNNIAHEYADKHQKDFKSWNDAFAFASQHAEDVSNKWYKGYKNHAVAFNQLEGFGKVSNAKMGGGYTYTYDSAVNHDNTTRLAELLNNTQGIEGAAVIQFGDAGTMKGNDPAAKVVFDQYYNDFMNVDMKHLDKARPKGSYSVARIGAGDENFMAYTIKLDEKYAAQYKGSEKRPGITGGLAPGQEITVFIPKDKAKNSYYEDTKYDIYDFMLHKGTGIDIEDPMAGKVKIEKVGNQIMTHGNLIAYNEKGEKILIPVTKTDNINLDGSLMYNNLSKELANLAQWNVAQRTMARNNYGIKDINKLDEFIKNQGFQKE